MHGVFGEISLVIVLAGVVGLVMHLLRQPAIVGYVLTGLIIGPLGYLHLNNADVLNSLSEIGITLLLFMVGLELTLKDLRQMGWVVVIAGLGQIAFMAILGTVIFTMFDMPLRAAVYLAVGVGVSSTIIAVKILSEKKDLDSLYGKLVLGILIVEDIISIIALTLITGFGQAQVAALVPLLMVLLKLLVLFTLAILLSRYVFPWLAERLGKSGELTFLLSLAWGLGFATLISDQLLGLTPEIGGFLAGLTLANTAQHVHIGSRMKPLRDFFLILFFIVLGTQLFVSDWGSLLLAAAGIVVLGVVIKPIFTFVLLTMCGYRGRTSFMTASSLAHISEFSIILAVLGFRAGHLGQDTLSIMTFSTILSFVLASYLLTHNEALAKKWRGFLSWWDPVAVREGTIKKRAWRNHIILIGGHRTAQSILHSLTEMHQRFLVVDFNPAIIKKLSARGINAIFGDVSDPELQESINMGKAKLIISTVPDFNDNMTVIDVRNSQNSKAKVVVAANNDWEAARLYEKGADYVLMPNFLSGLQLAEVLKKDSRLKSLTHLKQRDLELLSESA